MTSKLPSKSWSCGSLISGAAAVADQMSRGMVDEVVAEKRKTLREAGDLSTAEIEKLLEDC